MQILRERNEAKDVIINWLILVFVLCPLAVVAIMPVMWAICFVVQLITQG